MAIGLLTAGATANDEDGSLGGDVADTVNALYLASDESVLLPVRSLNPTGFADVNFFSQNDGKFIGAKVGSTQLYEINENLSYSAIGAPVNPSANEEVRTAKRLKSGNLLVSINNTSTGVCALWASVDNGSNWTRTLLQDVTNVRALTERSFCDAVVAGVSVIYYGEYNVNPLASGGNAEDKVVLWKSLDQGLTWSEVTRWNTGGSNNIRHIHCVKQFVDNGPIYVCVGDTNIQSGIYKWDGATSWPINTSFVDLVQSAGLTAVYGRQAYRAVDLAYFDGEIYWASDAITASATGPSSDSTDAAVFKMNADLSGLSVVSRCTTKHLGAAGWLAAVSSSGNIVLTTSPDDGVIAGNKYLGVIVSNENRTGFDLVGAYRCTDAATRCLPNGVDFIGEKLFISASNGSGKAVDSMITCEFTNRKFRGNFTTAFIPETLHPVYWVDSVNGSNANNGFTPAAAFAGFDHAITGDRVTYGARIQIAQSDTIYEGASIVPKFNANARGGDITEPASFYGDGATYTKLRYGVNGAAGNFFLISANAALLEFRNISVETDKLVRMFDTAGTAITVRFVNAKIGDTTKTCNGIARSDNLSKIRGFGSVFDPGKLVNSMVTGSSGTAAYFEFSDCAFLGSNRSLLFTNTAATNYLSIVNNKFYGFALHWLSVTATANFSTIYGVNNEISSTVTAAPCVTGGASVTWGRGFEGSKIANPVGVSSAFGSMTVQYPFGYEYNIDNYID